MADSKPAPQGPFDAEALARVGRAAAEAAWAEGMSLDGGVTPGVMVFMPGVTGFGQSVAALGGAAWPTARRRWPVI